MDSPKPAAPDARGPSTRRRIASVGAGSVVGVDAIPVVVEAVMHGDGHTVRLLGSVDRVMREAFHRVLNAFAASGLPSPRGMPTVNFSPAGLPKGGTGFDLPLALALAGAGGQLDPAALDGLAAFGEVGLDGRVRPVRGVVPIAVAARDAGWQRLLVAPEDQPRASVVANVAAHGVETLADALAVAASPEAWPTEPRTVRAGRPPIDVDMQDIVGHETAKKALCAAAAGRHNVLLIGPPGSGKSALVRRLPAILPPPDPETALDILKIRSASGNFDTSVSGGGDSLRLVRPFRAPHHSSSTASLLGGGAELRPGEVTLAHHGVLFLDEMPEFRREALEGLRQPVEEHRITIGRAARVATMPADFVLVAAMNPCPCGHAGDPRIPCRCSLQARRAYLSKVSGPLLDRFDIVGWVVPTDADTGFDGADRGADSGTLRDAVDAAVARAATRGLGPNGRLPDAALRALHDDAEPDVRDALRRQVRQAKLSGRGRARVLRLARTLADLAGSERLRTEDVLEATRLRRSWISG